MLWHNKRSSEKSSVRRW